MQAALFQAVRAAQKSPCCLVYYVMHPNIASTGGGTPIGCWLLWHPSDQDRQCITTSEADAQRVSEQHQVNTGALGRC